MGVVERIGILTGEVVKLKDNAELRFGDGANAADPGVGDAYIVWDGTDLDMVPTTTNSIFKIGTGTYSFDVWLYGNASSKYLVWDASNNTLHGSGGVSVLLEDSNYLKFGNSSDVSVAWDGTNLLMAAAADDSIFEIGDAADTQKSFDVKVYGNASDGYLLWDASADTLYLSGGENLQLMDNDNLKFGAGADVTIDWDGTNLVIAAAADDSLIEVGDANATQASFDVRFYGNTASGGSFLQWDASADNLIQSGGGVTGMNLTWTTGFTLLAAIPFMAGSTLGYLPIYSTLG